MRHDVLALADKLHWPRVVDVRGRTVEGRKQWRELPMPYAGDRRHLIRQLEAFEAAR
jgi:hypothetical protein